MPVMQRVLAILRGIGIFLIFLMLPTAILLTIGIFSPDNVNAAVNFLQYFSTLITTILLLGVWLLRSRHPAESLGFAPKRTGIVPHAAAFALGLFGNTAVSFLMAFLPASWLESYAEQSSGIYTPEQSVVSILSIVLFAPVCEEILFRGMIFRSFEEAMPFWLAAGCSALLFGTAHMHPVWIAYAFFMGFVFTVMNHRRGSLSVSIAAHMGFNLASLPSFLLDESSVYYQIISGSLLRYLITGIFSLLVCILLWNSFFSRRNIP